MEQLPRVQARLSSLHELRDLIRAMRALAASHVQEAQAALSGIRRYVEVVEDAIGECAGLLPQGARGLDDGARRDGSVLIVVTSEHGFAGAFNDRLLDRAAAARRADQQLVVIGRRGTALAAERGLAVDHDLSMATHVGGVLEIARRAALYMTDVATADIVYGGYRRGANFEPETRRVLPLDPALLEGAARRSPPLHHLAPAMLLQRLSSEYLFAEVTRAVMESLASENGARLRVMENADHNIGDKLDSLRHLENTLRQESITAELLDVVTGSEAVLNTDRP